MWRTMKAATNLLTRLTISCRSSNEKLTKIINHLNAGRVKIFPSRFIFRALCYINLLHISILAHELYISFLFFFFGEYKNQVHGQSKPAFIRHGLVVSIALAPAHCCIVYLCCAFVFFNSASEILAF